MDSHFIVCQRVVSGFTRRLDPPTMDGVRDRVSVRLPEALAWGLEALSRRSGKTKSEIVREALAKSGVGIPTSPEARAEVRRRAAEFRARQAKVVDATALIREAREDLSRRNQHRTGRSRCAGRRRVQRTTPGFQEDPLA